MTTLVRWDPAVELDSLQSEMNRLFDGFFGHGRAANGGTPPRWIPAMDLAEEGDDLVLTADLPGLTEDDVEAEYLKPGPAGDRLRDGALDAYFFVGGYPTGAISELATSSGIALVPIKGPEIDKLLASFD